MYIYIYIYIGAPGLTPGDRIPGMRCAEYPSYGYVSHTDVCIYIYIYIYTIHLSLYIYIYIYM